MWPFSDVPPSPSDGEPGNLSDDLADPSFPESLKRHLRGFGVPLNPKVRQFVAALHRMGVMTTCSGDLYGDDLIYVDLEGVPPEGLAPLANALWPLGWRLAHDNTMAAAHEAVAPGFRREVTPRPARLTRIVRAGAWTIGSAEADHLARTVHGALRGSSRVAATPLRSPAPRLSPAPRPVARPTLGADWPPLQHRVLARTIRFGAPS